MITATFKVGQEDALAMALHYYASSPAVKRSRVLMQATVPFVMVVVAALGYFRDAGWRYLVLVAPLLLIGVAWAALYPWLHRQYLRQTAEKFLKESSYQKAFGVYTLSLSESHIASASPVGEGTYVWSAVSQVSLTPHYLFIFLAGPQGYPIPRAQVADDTIQRMKTLAEEMSGSAESGARPNGRPATRLGSAGVSEGPPSVS